MSRYPVEPADEYGDQVTRIVKEPIELRSICSVITRSKKKAAHSSHQLPTKSSFPLKTTTARGSSFYMELRSNTSRPPSDQPSSNTTATPMDTTVNSVPTDGPSTFPLPVKTSPFQIKKIKEAQTNDGYVRNIIQTLTVLDKSQHDLLMKDGVLYKLLDRDGKSISVPYIPQQLVKEVLYFSHDLPTSGHFGRDKTWNQLKNKCYWPRMYNDIEKYVRSCQFCSQFNIRRSKPSGRLDPIEPPAEIFDLVGIDFAGPFPPTTEGNTHILVITDYLSKYVFAKALPDSTAKSASTVLVELSLQFGVPNVVLSDNGPSFIADLFQAVATQLGCNRILSTPYHPATNGQVERMNATIKATLAKLQKQYFYDWDQFLSG
ncbi:unnamed protein product, partial [Didymodactylos carnosus]